MCPDEHLCDKRIQWESEYYYNYYNPHEHTTIDVYGALAEGSILEYAVGELHVV